MISSFVRAPTANMEVFQRIQLLGSLLDAILNHRVHAQKHVPCIAVTMPMRHDSTLHGSQSRITVDRIKKAEGQGHGLSELSSLL